MSKQFHSKQEEVVEEEETGLGVVFSIDTSSIRIDRKIVR